jgi:hypothetical protein
MSLWTRATSWDETDLHRPTRIDPSAATLSGGSMEGGQASRGFTALVPTLFRMYDDTPPLRRLDGRCA